MKRYGILCLAALGIAGAAHAQTAGDSCRELPDTADAVSTIAFCSAALQVKGKSDEALAADHIARGKAYDRHGDYDKAIADFSAAFGLTPDDDGILDDAAVAYEDEGRLEAAIALYRLEVQLVYHSDDFDDPYFYGRYYLGRDEFQAGMYADAARDLTEFITDGNLDDKDSHYAQHYLRAVTWIHIARVTTGAADTDAVSLAKQSDGLDFTKWPNQIYAYLMDRIPRDTVFAAASKSGDEDALCFANYWVGEYDLARAGIAHKTTAAALGLLRKAAKLCGGDTEERYGANIAVQGKR